MRKSNALPTLIFLVILVVGLFIAYSAYRPGSYGGSVTIAIVTILLAYIASYATKVANQWERAVVLRLGRFRALEGPGLFFIRRYLSPQYELVRSAAGTARTSSPKDDDGVADRSRIRTLRP